MASEEPLGGIQRVLGLNIAGCILTFTLGKVHCQIRAHASVRINGRAVYEM